MTEWAANDGNDGKKMSDATQVAQSDPCFHTRSPEHANHLISNAFYPHRLRLLGPSTSFGLNLRATHVGPITVGEISYDTDVRLEGSDESRTSYHVDVPINGRLESRHRGLELTSIPGLAVVYRPDGDATVT